MCGVEKARNEFALRADSKTGLQSRCRACCAIDGARRAADWLAKNKDRAAITSNRYRVANIDRLNLANKAWVAANRKKVIKNKAAYRERHKEKLAIAQKERIKADPARRAAVCRRYGQNNRDKTRAASLTRRARRRGATTMWDAEFDSLVAVEASALAMSREQSTGFGWDIDHIEPLAGRLVCGLHNGHNLAVVPRLYNRRKNNKQAHALAWIASL